MALQGLFFLTVSMMFSPITPVLMLRCLGCGMSGNSVVSLEGRRKTILSIVVLVSFSPPSCHLLISDDVCLVISKRISQPFQGTHTIHFLLSSLRGGLPELFFSGASRNDVHGVPGTHRPWEFFDPTDPMDPGSVPMEAGQPHIGPVHRRAGKATGGRSSILMVV